jgi:hypothetical protein
MARERLGEILIKAGLLDEAGLQRALNEQQRWGGQLGRYLVELGLITEEILVRALSTQYKVTAVALDPQRLDLKTARVIPRDICERHNLICFRTDDKQKFLDVAMSDPTNLDAIDEIRVATKYNVRTYIAAPTAIDRAISFMFYGDMSLGGEMDLSPDSNLRLDTSSEFLKRAAIGAPEQAEPVPGAGGAAQLPQLDVKVSLSEARPAPAAPAPASPPPAPRASPPGAGGIELPDPVKDAAFHITMDVPEVDKETLARQSFETRISNLEATVARNSAVLKALLEGLAQKGLFTKQEIRAILGKK